MESRCKYLHFPMIYERFRSPGIGLCEVRPAPAQLALLASLLQLPVPLRFQVVNWLFSTVLRGISRGKEPSPDGN
jgi:hypothetical protein